jgi:RimJ/RimL family protein N-acetyltransferase
MFDYQPHLSGELLTMRPVKQADYKELSRLGHDPAVWELHPESDRYQEPRFAEYFAAGLASGGALVAISKETGKIAGWSRYSSDNAGANEIEIGWTFLARAYWGGAYNSDMKRMMLTHAFKFVDRVIFRIGATNWRSRRAVEKLGAVLVEETEATAIVVYALSSRAKHR